MTVGGQDFKVVIDTGSSDPWLAVTDFQCVDPKYPHEFLEQGECYFGPLYDSTESSTYEDYPDRSMNLSYAGGETLNGLMGRENFTMAGITVPSQEFGMVNYAAWYGDGVSSGLIGFAYRTLTSMYVGENPKAAVGGRALKYNPFFDNIYRSNTTDPVFSMALTRDTVLYAGGGLMGLGGIPDIPFAPSWITVPILPVGIDGTTNENVYQFYSVTVDGFSISSDQSAMFASVDEARQNPRKTALRGPVSKDPTNPNSTTAVAIVDSGTTLVYISDELAAEVTAAFTPPGFLNEDTGRFEVACNAIPPLFGVSIGGKIFNTNPDDMVLQYDVDLCISGVQGNGGGLWILGDVWMKSVLCVFDVGAGIMGFAGRMNYGLSWDEGFY